MRPDKTEDKKKRDRKPKHNERMRNIWEAWKATKGNSHVVQPK